MTRPLFLNVLQIRLLLIRILTAGFLQYLQHLQARSTSHLRWPIIRASLGTNIPPQDAAMIICQEDHLKHGRPPDKTLEGTESPIGTSSSIGIQMRNQSFYWALSSTLIHLENGSLTGLSRNMAHKPPWEIWQVTYGFHYSNSTVVSRDQKSSFIGIGERETQSYAIICIFYKNS